MAHAPVIAVVRSSLAEGPHAGAVQRRMRETIVARKQVSVLQLINAYRFLGVAHADVDPLKRLRKPAICPSSIRRTTA